jgi:hypothetical protein
MNDYLSKDTSKGVKILERKKILVIYIFKKNP